MAIFFDNKKRALSNAQLKAIFARANNKGIPKDEVIKKQTITNLNDEIRAEQAKGEKNYNTAVDKAVTKVFKIPQTPSKITVAIPPKVKTTKGPTRVIDLIRKVSVSNGISHDEARRILESSKVIPPGISGDAIVETKRRPSSPIQEIPIKEIKPRKQEEVKRKISDAILRRTLENQEKKQVEIERKQKILIEMGELRDERTQLLQQDLDRIEEKKSVPSGAVAAALAEPPLTTPGLVTGVEPLKQTTEETVKQKIRKRALDLEVLGGLSPQVAMDQAKREVVNQITS